MQRCTAACCGYCTLFLKIDQYPVSYLTHLRRENDITDVIFQTFSTTEERFGEMMTVELKPGGKNIDVTEGNKKEYVEFVTTFHFLYVVLILSIDSAIAEYKLSSRVHEQFEAFMSGFSDLVPHEAITILDERELEVRILATLLKQRLDYNSTPNIP
jgi:HECT-domain (ubiquitin-transferase)